MKAHLGAILINVQRIISVISLQFFFPSLDSNGFLYFTKVASIPIHARHSQQGMDILAESVVSISANLQSAEVLRMSLWPYHYHSVPVMSHEFLICSFFLEKKIQSILLLLDYEKKDHILLIKTSSEATESWLLY